MHRILCLVALVSVCFLGACQKAPSETASMPPPTEQPVASTPTTARTADGKYISWREHLIDDVSLSGVELAGSDGLVMGDLDLDGFDDIVSVHESDTEYDGTADGHIRIGFGSKDPNQWTNVTLSEGEEAAAPEDAAIGDLNLDGYPDIVAACELAHLIYFQNPGAEARTARWKRLIPPMTLNRGSYIRVFLADLNQDGRPEVVTANKGGQNPDRATKELNAISYFEIKGDPLDPKSWVEHELGRSHIPINSEPLDLDQDGDLDVIGGSRGEMRVFWFENVSEGKQIKFIEHEIQVNGSTVPSDQRPKGRPADKPLITGFNFDFFDLSGDGRLDIVLNEESNLVWLEQPDDRSKPWPMHLIGTHYPDAMTGILLQDINDDGRPDLITGGYSGAPRDRDSEEVTRDHRLGRLAWFEHPAENVRQPWTRHDISRRKRGMFDKFVARDLDHDGDMDFVSTRGNSVPYDGVFWLEQVRTEAPVGAFQRARDVDSPEMPLPSK